MPANKMAQAQPSQVGNGLGVERKLGRGAAACLELPRTSFDIKNTTAAITKTMPVSA